ncbi:MAG: ferritin-like domain-containing protein [bacterium]|nr:ferritin-like domain-containing protein [bacterium]
MYVVQSYSSISYADRSKYPKLHVMAPNEYYAEILQEDYAGGVSELTSVNQYEYHYIVNRRKDASLAKHLGNIEEVERRHLEMVGELIRLLGVDPMYRSCCNNDQSEWSCKRIEYGGKVTEQLKCDLEAEYRSIRNYNMHSKLIEDPYIKAILARIVKDEYVHVHILEALIRGER